MKMISLQWTACLAKELNLHSDSYFYDKIRLNPNWDFRDVHSPQYSFTIDTKIVWTKTYHIFFLTMSNCWPDRYTWLSQATWFLAKSDSIRNKTGKSSFPYSYPELQYKNCQNENIPDFSILKCTIKISMKADPLVSHKSSQRGNFSFYSKTAFNITTLIHAITTVNQNSVHKNSHNLSHLLNSEPSNYNMVANARKALNIFQHIHANWKRIISFAPLVLYSWFMPMPPHFKVKHSNIPQNCNTQSYQRL